MKELRITDAELQAVVGSALRLLLERRGFRMAGITDGYQSGYYLLPVNLGIDGPCEVQRYEDGTWAFRQHDASVQARFGETMRIHAEAIANADRPLGRG